MQACRAMGFLARAAGVRQVRLCSAAAVELFSFPVEPPAEAAVEGAAPVVVVHGMLGNATNWRTPAKMMAERTGRTVHCVDLRNHGRSPKTPVMTFRAMADDLAHFVEEKAGGRAVLLGHSLGGKAVMQSALCYPELVEALVVADIAPVDYARGGGKVMSQSQGYIKLLREMPAETMRDIGAAEKYLADNGVQPKGVRQFLLTNLTREGGKAAWRANLDVLYAHLEDGTLARFDNEGRTSVDVPTLIMTGGQSRYVKMEHHKEAFDGFFPNNTHVCIPDAGHWLHSQKPREFVTLFADWLSEVSRA